MESKVLGEGAYGCVHKPSLECDTNNDEDFYKGRISKFMNAVDATSELSEYSLIQRADPGKQYYLGNPTKCSIQKSAANIKAIKECKYTKKRIKNFKKIKPSLNKYSLLIMPDGGLNLKQWSEPMIKQPNTLKNRKLVEKFWVEMYRCFRGLVAFQKHNVLHHDIKTLNIVYNADKSRANYIDFGFMTTHDAIIKKSRESKNTKLGAAFWSWPLELMFINRNDFFKYAKLSDAGKRQFIDSLYRNIQRNTENEFVVAFTTMLNLITKNKSDKEFSNLAKQYFDDFTNSYLLEITPENYDSFLKRSVATIDVYGLGLALLMVLNNLKHLMDKNIYRMMYDCFFHMCTASLKNRYTADQAISVYENILVKYGYSVKDNVVVSTSAKQSPMNVKRMNTKKLDLLTTKMDEELEQRVHSNKSKTQKKYK